MENSSINFLVNELKKQIPSGVFLSRVSLKKGFLEWKLDRQYLLFPSAPRSAPFFLSGGRAPGEPISGSDINVIRKYLENSRLINIDKPLEERFIRFELEKRMIWGDQSRFTFTVHAGRVPTAWYITDPEDRILWSWNDAQAIAGTCLSEPTDDRKPFNNLSVADIREADHPKTIYQHFRGMGPAWARELIQASEPETLLIRMKQAEPAGGFRYPKDDFPIRMTSLGNPEETFSTFCEAIEYRILKAREQATFQSRQNRIHKRLVRELKNKTGLLEKLKKELKDCFKSEKLLKRAELLSANFTQLKKGMDSITVDDLETGEPVTISLDPELYPQDNIGRLYKRAARMKKKAPRVKERIRVVQSEIAALEDELFAIAQAESLADLPEDDNRKTKQKKASTDKLAGIIRINLEDGFFVYIGRHNKGNQVLYNQKLGPDDLWFHAKDIPGSHVVLKNPGGKDIPDSMIERAAELAAWFSKARNDTRVEIQYTDKSNLYSSKGKGQGFVLLRRFKTIDVEPKAPSQTAND